MESQEPAVCLEHHYIVDECRVTTSHAHSRVIPITVFYPGQLNEESLGVHYGDIFGTEARSAFEHLLRESPLAEEQRNLLIENSLGVQTECHSRSLVKQAEAPYPVILYSPSGGGNRFSNLRLLRKLVCSGYVVVSIDHPDEGILIRYPDGTLNSEAAERDDFIQITLERIDDCRRVLDFLFGSGLRPELVKAMDLNSIGAFGHSCGGYVSTLLDAEDDRIKAVSNVDGFPYAYWTEGTSGIEKWPESAQRKLRASRTPFLRVKRREDLSDISEVFELESRDFSGEVNFVIFEGWRHQDFALDRYKLKKKGVNEGDTIFAFEPEEKVDRLASVLIEFFDIYLESKPCRDLLDPERDESVKYRARRV